MSQKIKYKAVKCNCGSPECEYGRVIPIMNDRPGVMLYKDARYVAKVLNAVEGLKK